MKKTNVSPAFEAAKRALETAYRTNPADCGEQLQTLARAIACSVVNTCLDPQRKTAGDKETVSDSGQNPELIAIRRGITSDAHYLENLTNAVNSATTTGFSANGDRVTEVLDGAANEAANKLIREILTDGSDVTQEACLHILDAARLWANDGEWLDEIHISHKLSQRVYIKLADSAAYKDEEITPIQEIYRKVREYIEKSKSVRTNPANKYTYLSAVDVETADQIFYRLGKFQDLGEIDSNGMYTVTEEAARHAEKMLAALSLTDRQVRVLELRMEGNGVTAIATYLGVTRRAIKKTMIQIQIKAANAGFAPK